EVVLVIDAPNQAEQDQAAADATQDAATRAAELLAAGARPKEVAKTLVAEFALPRNAAYDVALQAAKGLA
ncbi:MAG: 16S rRNA (cytidine(1402)-2'-O)-methyltransferase, partial [Coriobacteriia bacterium]|nr:16S rRNA (cytidine(1402)-2'-O)-methyltransferase [Coriobacteriia bacterium]